MMRLRQDVFTEETAPKTVESAVSVLEECGFGAVCLVCTGSLEESLNLSRIFSVQMEFPLVLEVSFHKVLKYGLADFAEAATQVGISGIRIPDLPFEEQGQLAVYFLDEQGPFLIREVTPASGDRIIQNMQFARGFIWCGSQGNLDFLSELGGDSLLYYLYAVEAAAVNPVMLDFGSRCLADVENYINLADGVIVGNDLAGHFQRDGYSPDALREYCGRF